MRDLLNVWMIKKFYLTARLGSRGIIGFSDHIFILNTVLNSYLSRGKRVYACFVDFTKAYDSVWLVGLLYKLILNWAEYKIHSFGVINVHTGVQISTVKKLFDTLVRPVLLYNSKIWGAFLRTKTAEVA